MDVISKIYVINLDRRNDRYAEFLTKCPDELKPKIERVSAIDGRLLQHLSFKINNQYKTKQYDYSIKIRCPVEKQKAINACYLSHMNVLEKISQDDTLNDNDFCMIFEDDFFFSDNFNDTLQKSIHHIQSIDKHTDKKFVYISGRWNEHFTPSQYISAWKPAGQNIYYRPKGGNKTRSYCYDRGLMGYCLTKAMAKKLSCIDNSKYIAVDDLFVKYFQYKSEDDEICYEIFPHLGWSPLNYKSDINIKRNSLFQLQFKHNQ